MVDNSIDRPLGKQIMKVRMQPNSLDIPPETPFRNDLLRRQEAIQALTAILGGIEGSCALSVDAGWGFGKTTFLNMCAQYMRNQDFAVVQFNAWETDFTDDPLVALSTEITTGLKAVAPHGIEELRAATNSLARLRWPLARTLASVIPIVGTQLAAEMNSLDDANGEDDRLLRYEKTTAEVSEFREKLQKVANSLDGDRPLIVVIDELDRCRPSYAIELLEVAKHLFTVDRIMFVLATNRTQLAHSVKAIYGSEFDAEGYLERFFDIDYRLPEPDRSGFVGSNMNALGLSDPDVALVREVLAKSGLNFRGITQGLHRLRLAMASMPEEPVLARRLLAVLAAVRTTDHKTYYRWIEDEETDGAIVEALFQHRAFRTLSQNLRDYVEAVVIVSALPVVPPVDDMALARIPLYVQYRNLRDKPKPTNGGKDEKHWRHARAVLEHVSHIGRTVEDNRRFSNTDDPLGWSTALQHLELVSHQFVPEEAIEATT